MDLKTFFSFHFRPKLSFFTLILAILMLIASKWQWTRYHEKLQLVETYDSHASTVALSSVDLVNALNQAHSKSLDDLYHRIIKIDGDFDFTHQTMVINRRHATGPGQWLMTPFKATAKGLEKSIIFSRGFIPYSERDLEKTLKYSEQKSHTQYGVIKPSVGKRSFLSPSAETMEPRHFLYPDISLIQSQIPYPVYTRFYIQRIGAPVTDAFPAQDITIDVPPSTHFWYTFEWILLAMATVGISLLVQVFRPHTQPSK